MARFTAHASMWFAAPLLATSAAVLAAPSPAHDSTAREAARTRAAANPLGAPVLARLKQDAARLGFGASDSFRLAQAHRDEAGRVHGRFQQVHDGVPVHGARVIAHADGSYLGRGVPGISTPAVPRLSADDAVRLASGDVRHAGDFLAAPTATLMYFPVRELVRKDGRDPRVEESDLEINRDDWERRVVRTHLAWRVVGVEADRRGGPGISKEWFVDAHDGAIVAAETLTLNATGTGTGAWTNGAVSFNTEAVSCGFQMNDLVRQFETRTDDFGESDAVNCDGNNTWGDGAAFRGDNYASTANWQTAMVDGHFGATVYWDMMSRVWGFQGPDDDYYSVHVIMHEDTKWDNASYDPTWGNVYFGDGTNGKNRTVLDCLGHELGHAWNDHNSNYGTSGLNESLGDIFGEWTDSYLLSGKFAAKGTILGTASTTGTAETEWRNQCSGRDLLKPRFPTWSASLEDGEEHNAAGPGNRAFAFLAKGATPHLTSRNYSRRIPWGMSGIGLQGAARIFFRAHRDRIDNGDYADLRTAMLAEAAAQYGSTSASYKAVQNAYYSVAIGSRASNYPTTVPVTITESGVNNNVSSSPQYLGHGTVPPTGALAGAPNKLWLTATSTDSDVDWYRVALEGRTLSLELVPKQPLFNPVAMEVRIYNTDGTQLLKRNSPTTAAQVLTYTEPTTPNGVYTRLIRVSRAAGTQLSYRMDIDLGRP